MDIEHFAINVKDPRAMADWYVRHLGLRVLRSLNVENRMQAVVTAQRMGLLAARPQGIEPSLVPAPVPR